ncbi:hypothetical protein OLL83_001069 [Shewanella algae]|uniref:hypothetical protein n=1 Tax=Shewanella algae TaxID=38313 RepID=UPI00222E1B89|nr:hypothetical protein [Shewanella algae]UZD59533.1 hypothetical protein OLL83_001069 [Shewanella algae]
MDNPSTNKNVFDARPVGIHASFCAAIAERLTKEASRELLARFYLRFVTVVDFSQPLNAEVLPELNCMIDAVSRAGVGIPSETDHVSDAAVRQYSIAVRRHVVPWSVFVSEIEMLAAWGRIEAGHARVLLLILEREIDGRLGVDFHSEQECVSWFMDMLSGDVNQRNRQPSEPEKN